MKAKNSRAKDGTIVFGDSNHDWVQSPAIYERRYKKRNTEVLDYLPKWMWALLMRSMERQGQPSQVVVNDLRPASKGQHWHTFKVAVTTLLAAPIVLWAIPVVFDFYFTR